MVANVAPRLGALGVAHCLLLGTLATPLGAQDSVVVVPDAPACATCSLTVSAVVELGDREGPGIVAQLNAAYAQARVVRSDDGDYYVPAHLGDGRLLRFSSDGVFQEAIGRPGEGPGEYDLPMLMGGSADDLTILDPSSARLTTIRGGEVATTSLPFMARTWAVLSDGRYVYNGLPSWREGVGHPLHVYDLASRRITSSFGDEGVRVDRSRRGPSGHLRRSLAAAADGNIWVARENRYRIDKWSPDGDRIVRIERDAPWFRPWEEWPGVHFEVRPPPVIVGVGDWGDGLLMVIVRLADADWQPIRPTQEVLPGHESIPLSREEELYDTVIEVLDTRSGKVLARTRVGEDVVGLVGRDGFCSYAEHSDLGEPKYVVWSVGLSGLNRKDAIGSRELGAIVSPRRAPSRRPAIRVPFVSTRVCSSPVFACSDRPSPSRGSPTREPCPPTPPPCRR